MKTHFLITILFVGFSLALLADLTFTIYNLQHFDWSLEGNPIIKGPFSAILVKACVWVIAFVCWRNYSTVPYNNKFSTVIFLLTGILAQSFGAYSHVGIIQATSHSTEITRDNGTYTIVTPEKNYTVSPLEKHTRDSFYARTIGLMFLWPMIFASVANSVTQYTVKQ